MILKKMIILLSVLIFFLMPPPIFALDKTFHFCTDPWPPYIYGKFEKTASRGMIKELIDEIFKRIDGYNAVIDMVPWKRSLLLVEKGYKDGIPQLRFKKDRESFIEHSDPIFNSNTVFFYNKAKFPNGFNWTKLESIKSYKIGLIESYTISDYLQKKAKENNLQMIWEITNQEDTAFKRLGAGRFALLPTEEISGWGKCKKLGIINKIDIAKNIIYRKPYYIGLSKKSAVTKGLMPKINKAISEIKLDGTLARLMADLREDAKK